ncbi:Asp23/Gls24 family envelope stress response protein [Kineococcus sp. SYSU DK006]|uniref:Asp23/Gls24 family envelope stress response protein n=1 Tax=Kineococcus sp. SYSU DK006 TaxID=3383127 RepID=UPI003D7E1298
MADPRTALAPAGAAAVAPEHRGRLAVADRAVQRIAAAAATEVEGTRRTTGSGPRSTAAAVGDALGAVLGRAYPDVECSVAGRRARVRVEVAAVWPHPAPQVAARVREHVRARLEELADLSVDDVSVVVATYLPPTAAAQRRVQ